MKLAGLAILPLTQHALSVIRHDPGVGSDAFPMEGRLDQPPLPAPEFALAGQRSIAEQQPSLAQVYALAEIRAPRHQHRLDQVGAIDQVNGHMQEAHANHIAVFKGAAGQKPQRVAIEFRKRAEKDSALEAGWKGFRRRRQSRL